MTEVIQLDYREPNVLFLDIETTPIQAYVWAMYQTDVMEIIEHPYILCFGVRWLNEKKTVVHALPDFKSYRPNTPCDAPLLNVLWDYLDKADVVVAHNGKRFDIPKINARFIYHKMSPPSPYVIFDTLKEFRRASKFPSNRQDDLAPHLGIERKVATTKRHWIGCIDGEKECWKVMRRYNAHDVDMLFELYHRIRPWSKHPNLNNWTRDFACPVCQSNKLQKRGLEHTRSGQRQRYKCMANACGKWSCGPIMRCDPVMVN